MKTKFFAQKLCVCVFVSSSALNESSFVAKTKFFCQQKVWVLFLYKQPSSCVGLFSTFEFYGKKDVLWRNH